MAALTVSAFVRLAPISAGEIATPGTLDTTAKAPPYGGLASRDQARRLPHAGTGGAAGVRLYTRNGHGSTGRFPYQREKIVKSEKNCCGPLMIQPPAPRPAPEFGQSVLCP